MKIYDDLVAGRKTLAVIGLGYVGLPIALLFARKIKVLGFDINASRIAQMQQGIDPSGEIPTEQFQGANITFTANPDDLKGAHFFVVAVPTPIDRHNQPDLTPVLKASETLAKALKPGDYVVYESTVYPGCTEEDCIPILETSGLKFVQDFKVGYSPERINPGDPNNKLENTNKIVSGCDDLSAEEIYQVYKLAIQAELHRAPTIKVAEAAKIIENTQRDLNIALMNELSIIFGKMGINTYDVLAAAGTKWNFHPYSPGLVGGHCIGVDPYYLIYKANELGYHSKVINAGRAINDGMGPYIGEVIVKQLTAAGKALKDARVLIMGITFKENVQDIRNSKVVDVYNELKAYNLSVDVVDPHAVPDEVHEEYGITLSAAPAGPYDAILLAVAHQEYRKLEPSYFEQIGAPDVLVADIKGMFRGRITNLRYWSL
ncbi:MAG: nucleotide sugar dehydrogenase [Bacteroidia bacterium]|nr:nucleotide sugar dehydrogenase [Bacteroidia bacterium]